MTGKHESCCRAMVAIEQKHVYAKGCFIASLCLLACRKCAKGNTMLKSKAAASVIFTNTVMIGFSLLF